MEVPAPPCSVWLGSALAVVPAWSWPSTGPFRCFPPQSQVLSSSGLKEEVIQSVNTHLKLTDSLTLGLRASYTIDPQNYGPFSSSDDGSLGLTPAHTGQLSLPSHCSRSHSPESHRPPSHTDPVQNLSCTPPPSSSAS